MLKERVFLIGVVEGCKTIAFDKYGRPVLRRKKVLRKEHDELKFDD